MNRRSARFRYLKFVSRYKKLEEEKKKCLQQYFNNQTIIQLHSTNIIKSLNNILSHDLPEDYFKLPEEFTMDHSVHRQVWKNTQNTNFWEEVVPTLSDADFKEHFRMTRKSFEKLCGKLLFLTHKDTAIRKAIPLEKRIAVALNTLGTCTKYKGVSDLFGIGRTTVGELCMQFAGAVCDAMEREYVCGYPPSSEIVEENVQGFELLGIPQCYGVLGTYHVEISAHRLDSVDCINSKGWRSVVLLAIVDHKGRVIFQHVGSKGSLTDNEVFENSPLLNYHESNELLKENWKIIEGKEIPIILVGTPAFPLSKFIMKEFPKTGSRQRADVQIFNKVIANCREIFDKSFERLRARFLMMSQGLEVSANNCNTVIRACCILHNFLNDEDDEVLDAWLTKLKEKGKKNKQQPRHTIESEIEDAEAIDVRNTLANYMRNNK